jgi:hypothetical protein
MQFTNPLFFENVRQQPQQQQQYPAIIIVSVPHRNYNIVYMHICGILLLICIGIGVAYFLNDNSFSGAELAAYVVITAIGALYFLTACIRYICCYKNNDRDAEQGHLEDNNGDSRV